MQQNRSGRTVFSPEQASTLSRAFDTAWRSVRFAFDTPSEPEAIRIRRQIAAAILAHAREGVADERALVQHAIAHLPPLEAKWNRAAS